jgi:DNA primase
MRDESDTAPAKVVFTFDGDAAGQKAAMRAFGEDQRWASQSFVAVEASGQDPCDLRLSGGDAAVRALVEDAVPMFEFAVRTTISRFDLDTAEGRVQALRAAAPIIAGIRDRSLRPEYTRTVAGWLGLEVEQVSTEVQRAGRSTAGGAPGAGQGGPGRRTSPYDGDRRSSRGPTDGDGGADHHRPDAMPRPDLRDPVVFAERQLLQAVLQFPSAVDQGLYDSIEPASFSAPAHRAVHDAVAAAGGLRAAAATAVWADKVGEAAAATVRGLVSELAVAPVPARVDAATGMPDARYVNELLIRVREVSLTRRIGDAMSALRRMDSGDPAAARALAVDLQTLQRELAALRERLA